MVVRSLLRRQITVPRVVSKASGFASPSGAVTTRLSESISRRPLELSARTRPENPRNPGRMPEAATPTSSNSPEIVNRGESESSSLTLISRLRTTPLGSRSLSKVRRSSLSHGNATMASARFR